MHNLGLICSLPAVFLGLYASGSYSSGDAGGDPPCAAEAGRAVFVLDTSSRHGLLAQKQVPSWIFSSSSLFVPRTQRTASPRFVLGPRPPRSPVRHWAESSCEQPWASTELWVDWGDPLAPAPLLSPALQLSEGLADPPSPGSSAPMPLLGDLTPSPRLPTD